MLVKLYKLNVALSNVNSYGVKFFNKSIKRLIPKKTFHIKAMDELNNDPDTFQFHGGVQELINVTRNHPEQDLHFKGIGLMLYHMGKEKKFDTIIYKRIEMNLYKFKGLFPHRLAFGAFHGFINLNLKNPYMQDFLENEFNRTISDLNPEEAIEIIEACGNNTVLTKEYKHELIRNSIMPVIELHFEPTIQFNYKYLINLFNALISASFFDEAIFDKKLIEKLVDNKRIRSLDKWLYIKNKLIELNNGGNFPRKLDDQIAKINQTLKSREDFTWLYNVDENRFYSMQEMIAKREDPKYANQTVGKYQFYPKEYQARYLELKQKGETELKKEEEEFRKKLALDDLMYDKYILQKLKEENEDIDINVINEKIELSMEKGEDSEEKAEESEDELESAEKQKNIQKKKKQMLKQRKGRQKIDESKIEVD